MYIYVVIISISHNETICLTDAKRPCVLANTHKQLKTKLPYIHMDIIIVYRPFNFHVTNTNVAVNNSPFYPLEIVAETDKGVSMWLCG